MTSSRLLLPLGLAAIALSGCGSTPDPIDRDVDSVKARSIPPGARLSEVTSLRREHETAHAEWQLEIGMPWDAYADWVTPRLSEYRLVRRDGSGLLFSRQLDADVYVVELKRKPGEKDLTVQASFEARPF